MYNTVHIVSFNVPYPPDYGGVIDVFYKINALKDCGVNVILHCYEYGREQSDELKNICKEVYYYKRKKTVNFALKKNPFIVATRNSENLFIRLKNDNFPIIFEGLHTTFWLTQLIKFDRKIVVRTHNIEHKYYSGLAKAELNIAKKIFFNSESRKLKKYEPILEKANNIAAISIGDQKYFNSKYQNSKLIQAFHPYKNVEIKDGKGNYVLFHGDLSVSDNIKSALFLINIFKEINIPLIIAGKNPHNSIISEINNSKSVKLIINPDNNKMDELISNAQINLLYTFQDTGIKLKLIASLYRGRHCIVNNKMINNTGLEGLCYVSNSVNEIKNNVLNLFNIPFNFDDIARRKLILDANFDVKTNALKLCKLLF